MGGIEKLLAGCHRNTTIVNVSPQVNRYRRYQRLPPHNQTEAKPQPR